MPRLDDDLALVAREFPDAIIAPNKSYFVLPSFRLPSAVYRQEKIKLRVDIPPTYPSAPPDNFFTQWDLGLASAGTINNYSGPVHREGETWGTFSFHADQWDPNVDNLLSFLAAVYQRLAEGA